MLACVGFGVDTAVVVVEVNLVVVFVLLVDNRPTQTY